MEHLYKIEISSVSMTVTRYDIEGTMMGGYDICTPGKGTVEKCYALKSDISNYYIIRSSKVNKLDKWIMPDNNIVYEGYFEKLYTVIITPAFYEDKIADIFESFRGDIMDYTTMRRTEDPAILRKVEENECFEINR